MLASAITTIIDSARELSFSPKPAERMLKADYVVKSSLYPGDSMDEVSCAEVIRVTGDQRLHRWWKKPGFKEWFRGKDEWAVRVEYLNQLGLDTAEDILTSDDPKSVNAKVALIKALMEAGGKVSRGKDDKLLDEAISKMNKVQLANFLKKGGVLREISDDKKEESKNS